MTIGRRDFIGAALAAGVGYAQEVPPGPKAKVRTRTAKMTKLYRSPDLHPTALKATRSTGRPAKCCCRSQRKHTTPADWQSVVDLFGWAAMEASATVVPLVPTTGLSPKCYKPT